MDHKYDEKSYAIADSRGNYLCAMARYAMAVPKMYHLSKYVGTL
jgi:hypothetical protein